MRPSGFSRSCSRAPIGTRRQLRKCSVISIAKWLFNSLLFIIIFSLEIFFLLILFIVPHIVLPAGTWYQSAIIIYAAIGNIVILDAGLAKETDGFHFRDNDKWGEICLLFHSDVITLLYIYVRH
jgi:hypothetical protein